MRFVFTLAFLLAAMSVGLAQENQFGVAGGFGFYRDATLTNSSGTARAGFGPRFAASAVISRKFRNQLGADLRYTFQDGDSELRSGSVEANLDAHAHAIEGDLLLYLRGPEHRLQPYVSGGFGIKVYQSTEVPANSRPLTNFATLVHGSQTVPLVTMGSGMQYPISSAWSVRIDLRDYATPFPDRLFPAAPGARVSGWLHDFVPLIGISRRF